MAKLPVSMTRAGSMVARRKYFVNANRLVRLHCFPGALTLSTASPPCRPERGGLEARSAMGGTLVSGVALGRRGGGGGEIEWDGEASRIQAFAGLTPEARGLRRERGAGDLSSRQAEPPLSNDVPLDF